MSFKLKVSDDGYAAYLTFPDHPGEAAHSSRTVSLTKLMGDYDGPYILFDFDDQGKMIGVEVLADNPEDDEWDGDDEDED